MNNLGSFGNYHKDRKGSFWKAFLQKVLKMTNEPTIHLDKTMYTSDIIQETDGDGIESSPILKNFIVPFRLGF